MQTLIFRITSAQMRGLCRTALGLAVPAVALAAATTASGAGWIEGPGILALLLAAAAAAAVTALACCARCFTECTPDGIRTRGYGRTRTLRWAEVAVILSGGRQAPGASIWIVTTDCSKIRLGAPAAAVIVPDPDIRAKLKQIRSYWHAAEAAAQGAGLAVPAQAGAFSR